MFYRNELHFLCETLRKSRVRATVLASSEVKATATGTSKEGPLTENPFPFSRIPQDLEPHTIYKLTDPFDLCYRYLLLPDTEEPTLLVMGPYLTALPSRERLLELGERRGVSPAQQQHFEEYYSSIPVLPEGNHLFIMLTTFCERIWQRPSFAIVDVNNPNQIAVSPINEPIHNDKLDDVLVNMKTMEKRYAFENELIRAVTLGQIHKEEQLLSAFSGYSFEKRLPDPLRNAKNYSVIMNTLLRKAAENGGVHPVYLDRVSSEFAAKIEQIPDLTRGAALMREMFRSYCRLVRKHALTHFSLAVQKTILLIDSDLSANLSLKSLADHQNISYGYLCAIFKKETGKTVSQYIREKRIKYATHLLATTQLQIQTIALHCGIMDVQYFSKTFKKLIGKTPKEYRESVGRAQEI